MSFPFISAMTAFEGTSGKTFFFWFSCLLAGVRTDESTNRAGLRYTIMFPAVNHISIAWLKPVILLVTTRTRLSQSLYLFRNMQSHSPEQRKGHSFILEPETCRMLGNYWRRFNIRQCLHQTIIPMRYLLDLEQVPCHSLSTMSSPSDELRWHRIRTRPERRINQRHL